MDLSENIQAAIKEKLPEAVAGELRKYLESAKLVEVEVILLRKNLDQAHKCKDEQSVKLQELAAKVKLDEDLRSRSLQLDARERAFEVELLKVKLAAETEKAKLACELVNTVFRNPRLTYSESSQGNMPVAVPSGSYVSQGAFNVNRGVGIEETK